MRITVVGGPFLPMPPAPCGAVERIWHGLAEEFIRKGHEVTVICRSAFGQKRDDVVNGVHYLRRSSLRNTRNLKLNLLKDLWYSLRVLGILPRADIIVTNTFWLPAMLSLVGRHSGRIAVHVQRMPKGQLRLYDRVHRLQAVSQAIKSAIVAERPRLEPKVRVFPNPIDTRVFVPPSSRSDRARQTLLYTGRIHPEKGLHLLVDAYARLAPEFPALRLRIVGPWQVELGGGGPDFVKSLRDRARGLEIEFTEAIFDRQRLASVYQDADFYCYPSTAEQGEASPVAPVEAMATGLVPLVSDLDQFRDTITPGETGWFFDHRAPDPITQLSQMIRRVLTDPEQSARMSNLAREKASSLSYECVADLYLADFAEMLAQ